MHIPPFFVASRAGRTALPLTMTPSGAPPKRGLVRLIGMVCMAFVPGLALAQQPAVVNWPLPTPAAGENPATLASPRNEWMQHFQRSLDRTQKGNVDLIFDGDSITDFWMNDGKEVWARNYGKLNAVDFGIGGDRTENILWRLDKGQVAGLHPKLIAILIGTNNTRDCSDVQIADGITAVVQAYQRLCPDAVILLQALLPRAEKPTDPAREKVASVNCIISKLGDGNKVLYTDFGDGFVRPDGTINRDLMPDALHPNAKGYEIWAEAIRPTVERVLGPATPAR